MNGDDPKVERSIFDDDTLIEHAERMWEAEVENARRLSQRVNLLFSVMAALFGLGLFKIEWYRKADEISRINSVWAECLVRTLLIIAIGCIAYAFWKLLAHLPRKSESPQASHVLALDPEFLEHPGTSIRRAKKAAFIKTYLAAQDLRRRNIRELERVDESQRPLIIGLSLVLISLLVFIATSGPK